MAPVSSGTYSVPAGPNNDWNYLWEVNGNQIVTVTVSGSWSYDPGSAPCGAGGRGGTVNDGSFRSAGTPIGALCWCIAHEAPGVDPRITKPNWPGVTGWFTSDNQTITWNNTSPGDGSYFFGMMTITSAIIAEI